MCVDSGASPARGVSRRPAGTIGSKASMRSASASPAGVDEVCRRVDEGHGGVRGRCRCRGDQPAEGTADADAEADGDPGNGADRLGKRRLAALKP